MTKSREDMPQNLTQLVSAHQLLSYPSEDPGFNHAYEEAIAASKSTAFGGLDLYIVQYRADGDVLRFSFVSESSISSQGPYFLTDICAVVRTPPLPRLVLHADCTTCGPVCDQESDADWVSKAALAHVAQTKHVVVLNGTADLPE
jgi:hypothetical protein